MTPHPWIDPLARYLAEALGNTLWQGLTLALLAWLVLRLLPRTNAATRYAIWTTTLAAVVALPFVSFWHLGALEASATDSPRSAALLALPAGWAMAVLAAWALVASILLVRVLWSFGYICWLARTSAPLPDPYPRHAARLAGSASSVRSSRQISVPVVIGLRHPAILIPEALLACLSPEEFDQIVLHEWSHVRRCDHWTNLVQELLKAVFFFQPAVWWIGGQMRLEREIACDDAVVAATGRPLPYAGCLTKLVEWSSRAPAVPAPGAVASGPEVVRRVERLARGERGGLSVSRLAWLAASAALILASGLSRRAPAMVAVAQPAAASESPTVPQLSARLRLLDEQNRLAAQRLQAADETLRAAHRRMAEADSVMRQAKKQMRAADQRMQKADEQMRAANQRMSLADILSAGNWFLPAFRVSCPAPPPAPGHKLRKI